MTAHFVPPLQAAHNQLITRLAATKPNHIKYQADSVDLENRADHVREVFVALAVYMGALIRDTAALTPMGLAEHESYLVGLIEDCGGDIAGNLVHAAERLREDA